jgi:hypothetical protein
MARSLADEYPHLIEEWHPAKNGDLTPADVMPFSRRKVWWICKEGHEWESEVRSRTNKGSGCPYCANRVVLVGYNDLATMRPDLAEQWHPELNGKLTPQLVTVGSHKKVWWRCEKGHEWKSVIYARERVGSGCPVCAGKQIIPGYNDLASYFPDVAAQWHPVKNGTLTPQMVAPYSNRRVWWVCDKGHEYRASVLDRTGQKTECPYCTNRKVLVGFNDLATKHPKIAAQWHPQLNGKLTPEMVTSGSRKNVWWQCEEGHVWRAVIYSRTGKNKTGCPICSGRVNRKRVERYARITETEMR